MSPNLAATSTISHTFAAAVTRGAAFALSSLFQDLFQHSSSESCKLH